MKTHLKFLHNKWFLAFLSPFLMALVFIATETAFDYGRDLEGLPFGIGFILLLMFLLGPGAAIIYFRGECNRFLHLLIYAGSSVLLMPALWFFVLFAGCKFFHECL